MNFFKYLFIIFCVIGSCSQIHAQKLNSKQKKDFIAKFFEASESHSKEILSFEAEIYLKDLVETKEKNSLYKLIHLVPNLIISDTQSDTVFTEVISRQTFTYPDRFVQKVDVAHSTSKKDLMIKKLPYQIFNTNIYGTNAMNGDIILPFREENKELYNYSIKKGGKQDEWILSFHPKIPSPKLLNGYAIVDPKNFNIKEIYCSFKNSFDSYFITVIMGQDDGILALLPERYLIESNFSLLGIKLKNTIFSDIKYSNVKRSTNLIIERLNREQYSGFKNYASIISDSIEILKNEIFWRKNRVFRFLDKENSILDKTNKSLLNASPKKTTLQTFISKISSITSPYSYKNKNVSLKLNGFISLSSIKYNSRDGFGYSQKFRAKIEDDKKQHDLTIFLAAEYITRAKFLRVINQTLWNHNPANRGYLCLEASSSKFEYNKILLDSFLKNQKYSSNNYLLFDKIRRSINYDISLRNNYELLNGFNVGAEVELRKIKGYADPKSKLTPLSIKSISTHINLEWVPDPQYTFHRNKKLYLYSKYPILQVNFSETSNNLKKNKKKFYSIETNISQNFDLKLGRSIQYSLGFGLLCNVRDIYFFNYKYFSYDMKRTEWDLSSQGYFALLPYEYYLVSPYYFQYHIKYNAPHILLNRFKPFNKFFYSENLFLSLLKVQVPHPYIELGYELMNKYVNLAAICSYGGSNEKFKFGARASLKF